MNSKNISIALILGCVIIAIIVAMGMNEGKLDNSLTKFIYGFSSLVTGILYGVVASKTPVEQPEEVEKPSQSDGETVE